METTEETKVGDPKDCPGICMVQYEYLDHTADVQLHSWGSNIVEAFEQEAVAMFAYMTEIDKIQVTYTYDIEAKGDDLESLLFHFLDEWLFAFSAEPFFIPSVVKIMEFDREQLVMRCRGWGETFDIRKHPQGTEVKAITYSNMQIHEKNDRCDLYVIIDI